jgi:hypothetical protein
LKLEEGMERQSSFEHPVTSNRETRVDEGMGAH